MELGSLNILIYNANHIKYLNSLYNSRNYSYLTNTYKYLRLIYNPDIYYPVYNI